MNLTVKAREQEGRKMRRLLIISKWRVLGFPAGDQVLQTLVIIMAIRKL